MAKKLRLLKVLVQPVFVVDDGENLTEQSAHVVSVPACDWAEFASSTFDIQVEKLRREMEC